MVVASRLWTAKPGQRRITRIVGGSTARVTHPMSIGYWWVAVKGTPCCESMMGLDRLEVIIYIFIENSTMLSTTTKHAIRALVVLAESDDVTATLGRDLADRANIPANYLSKILLDLRKAGLVDATRGSGGGYKLAKPADRIALVAVVEVFEGVLARPACLLGCDHPCSDETPCSAHSLWREVRQTYISFLETTTLADIATYPGTSVPCAVTPPDERVTT